MLDVVLCIVSHKGEMLKEVEIMAEHHNNSKRPKMYGQRAQPQFICPAT